MITLLEQLHHSLAVITNLSMSIPRASNFGILFLNANLDCSDLHLKCIGSDEEGGSVLKVMKKQEIIYAMKVYPKDTGTPIENMISRDQAYREFKALKLTSTHLNFLRLCSNELDECQVQQEDPNLDPYNAWVIRFDYVPDSMPINEFWFYLGTVYHENKLCIHYTTKSILITHYTSDVICTESSKLSGYQT